MNQRSRDELERARRGLGSRPSHGQVVASVSFGFWAQMTHRQRTPTFWAPGCGLGQGGAGRDVRVVLHQGLLAASPSGKAPDVRCQDAIAGSLAVRRSVALSPVDGRRVLGNGQISQSSCWTSKHQASRAIIRRHLRCISSASGTADVVTHPRRGRAVQGGMAGTRFPRLPGHCRR